jgi:hypothetical protein
MENENKKTISPPSKKARIGFILLFAGPLVLVIPTLIESIGTVPHILALFFAIIAGALPGIGAVFAIMSLIKWKELDGIAVIMSVITIVMCNPIFYMFYWQLCMAGGYGFAGMSMM